MAERYLTFAEVERLLGLSTDEVRELMESRALKGALVGGVIQFHESEVKRLRGKPSAPRGRETDKDAGFVFLVDEEEEKRIEGKAYDGEELLKARAAEPLAPDEEIIEPVGLSEEQLRNSAVLGTEEAVEFGRGVAERSRRGELASADLSEGEEIIDASKVELPEPDFGKLASAVSEARREEPPRPEPPAAAEKVEKPAEPEAEKPEEELVRPTLRVPEKPAEPAPVEEEIPVTPREEVVEAAAAQGAAFGEPEAAEAESEKVEFKVDGEPEPIRLETTEKELTFLEEATGPMVCPIGPAAEEAPVQEAAATEVPAEAKSEEPEAPRQEAVVREPEETFEVTPAAPMTPVTEAFERAVDEEVADLEAAPEPVDIEELASEEEIQPATEPGAREALGAIAPEREAPPGEPVAASQEPERPAEEALREETAPEEAPAAERGTPAETVEPEVEVVEEVHPGGEPAEVEATRGETSAREVKEPETFTPPVERAERLAERALPPPTAEEPGDVFKELEEEFLAEERGVGKTPVGPGTYDRAGSEQPAETDLRKPESLAPAAQPREEVEQVTEEKKKGEKRARPPEEERTPPAGEQKKAEEEVAPENIEVFDLETPADKGVAAEEGLVTLEEEAPAGAAPGAAAAKDQTLEEEMAELFGEEKPERAADEAFAAQAPAEDFDLSVFQKEAGGEEARPVAEESLFEVEEPGAAPLVEPPVDETVPDADSSGRIRAFTEERRGPSNVAFTAAALLAFVVLAFTGMLLWHIFITQ